MLSENQFRIIEYLFNSNGSDVSLEELKRNGIVNSFRDIDCLTKDGYDHAVVKMGYNETNYKFRLSSKGISAYHSYLIARSESEAKRTIEAERLELERRNAKINEAQNRKSTIALWISFASLLVSVIAVLWTAIK